MRVEAIGNVVDAIETKGTMSESIETQSNVCDMIQKYNKKMVNLIMGSLMPYASVTLYTE